MFVAVLITAAAVVVNVSLHLVVLRFLYTFVLPWLRKFKPIVIGVMVLGAITGHLLEIGLFAGAVAFIAGQAVNAPAQIDALFWSPTAYTSLGSDYPQIHELRMLASVEALNGLILITWTASFLFLLMQKYWIEKTNEP